MHEDILMCTKAVEMIEAIVRKPEVGEVIEGTVVRVESYGAFVELWKGCEGLCHVSKLADHRVEKAEDEVKIGDKLLVKIIKIDEKGRIDLSHSATIEGYEEKESRPKKDFKDKKDSKSKDSKKRFVKKSSVPEDEDVEVVVVTTGNKE